MFPTFMVHKTHSVGTNNNPWVIGRMYAEYLMESRIYKDALIPYLRVHTNSPAIMAIDDTLKGIRDREFGVPEKKVRADGGGEFNHIEVHESIEVCEEISLMTAGVMTSLASLVR